MSFTVHSAVVTECERCRERSKPLDPSRVGEWQERHAKVHEREDRKDRCEAIGHKITLVAEWMDCDDSSGHAKCSCGWRSRSAKACWSASFADGHLEQVEADSSVRAETE